MSAALAPKPVGVYRWPRDRPERGAAGFVLQRCVRVRGADEHALPRDLDNATPVRQPEALCLLREERLCAGKFCTVQNIQFKQFHKPRHWRDASLLPMSAS